MTVQDLINKLQQQPDLTYEVIMQVDEPYDEDPACLQSPVRDVQVVSRPDGTTLTLLS